MKKVSMVRKAQVLDRLADERGRYENRVIELEVDLLRWQHDIKRLRKSLDKFDRQEMVALKRSITAAKARIKNLDIEIKYWDKM